MNPTQELERLAKLHADGALTSEEFAKAKSQVLSTPLNDSISAPVHSAPVLTHLLRPAALGDCHRA